MFNTEENGNGTEGEEQAASAGQNGAKAPKTEKGRIKITSKEEADAILADLQGAAYTVLKVEEKEQRRQPYLPYTTSTLQQDALGATLPEAQEDHEHRSTVV